MGDKPEYCIFYHKECTDGYGAAYAAHLLLEPYFKVTYIPIHWRHKIDIPLLEGKRVFFFDVCVEEDQLLEIQKVAENLEVHDHHDTVSQKVGTLDCVYINMSKSGAVLAWERCVQEIKSEADKKTIFPKHPLRSLDSVPEILLYIQASDLNKHETMDNVHLFSAMIQSYPYDFAVWNHISNVLEDKIHSEGPHIYRADVERAKERILRNKYFITLQDTKIAVLESPTMPDFLCNQLAEEHEIGLVWKTDGRKIYVSLRSKKPTGPHVGKMAEAYDGGGHKHSAGFSVSLKRAVARTILNLIEEDE